METVTNGHHSDNLQLLAQLSSPDKHLVPSSCQKNLNLKGMQFLYQPELLIHMQSALRSKKQQEPRGPGRKQDPLLWKVDKRCSQ